MKNLSVLDIINSIDSFSPDEKNLLLTYIEQKTDNEKILNLVNSIAIKAHTCPHCGSHDIRKFGTNKGLQRFDCKNCLKKYNSLTGTPLAHLHKREQWLNMASALNDSISLDKTALRCHIAHSTAFRWRHKFLKNISTDMPKTLDGIVEADETYLPRSHKGKHNDDEKPRKRGGIKGKGLSQKFVGLIVALDRLGGIIDGILDDSSTKSITKILKNRLSGRSKLCIDGGSALWGFVTQNKVSCAIMPSGKYICEYDPIYHIQTVNSYHSRLKSWIGRFHGVATKYLPSYLGWFRKFEQTTYSLSHVGWLQNSLTLPVNPF